MASNGPPQSQPTRRAPNSSRLWATDYFGPAISRKPRSVISRRYGRLPTWPSLAFRLGQIAMVRGQYDTAAARIREAETAQPGWIINAPDIQALYAEPADFANNVARLETHLQANPDDRDAWLVLGAEWFLSGRTTKAADVFKRLNDPNRKPDVALAAFLDASNQAELRAEKPPRTSSPVR